MKNEEKILVNLNFENKDIENTENNINAEEENNKNTGECTAESIKKAENNNKDLVSNSKDSDKLSFSIVKKKCLKKSLKYKINIQ